MHPKDADRIADSVDPDQTAPSRTWVPDQTAPSLIWVYTVCSDLFVQKLIITV